MSDEKFLRPVQKLTWVFIAFCAWFALSPGITGSDAIALNIVGWVSAAFWKYQNDRTLALADSAIEGWGLCLNKRERAIPQGESEP